MQVFFLNPDLESDGDPAIIRSGQPHRPDPQTAEPAEVAEKGKIDEPEKAVTTQVAHELDHGEVKLGASLKATPAASAVGAEIPRALEHPRDFDGRLAVCDQVGKHIR